MPTVYGTLAEINKAEEEVKQLQMVNKKAAAQLKHLDLLDQLIDRTKTHAAVQEAGSVGGDQVAAGLTGEPTPVRGSEPQEAMGSGFMNELIPLVLGLQGYGADMGPAVSLINTQTDPKKNLIKKITDSMGSGGSPINLKPGGSQESSSGGGLEDIVVGAAKGDKSSLAKMAALKMADVDLGDAVRALQASMRTTKMTAVDAKGFAHEYLVNAMTGIPIPGSGNTGEWKGTWREMATPGGGASSVPVVGPSILGGGTPVGTPGIVTRQPEREIEIPMADLPSWKSPKTLDSPPPGMTPTEAAKNGFYKISTNIATMIDSLRSAKIVSAQVQELMPKVFPVDPKTGKPISESPYMGRLAGSLKREYGSIAQTNPEASILVGLVNGTLAPTIRALGEKGTLSEGDTVRAKGLQISLTDRADVAWGRVKELQNLMDKIQKNLITSNFNTDSGGSGADKVRAYLNDPNRGKKK